MIKKEKDLATSFVRGHIVGKKYFVDALPLPYGYGKEKFINAKT